MTGTARPPEPGPAARPRPEPDLTVEHLPCGRAIDPLIELATSGRGVDLTTDEHVRACVHCRALLAEAARLWSPVHDLAARQETPPRALLDSIMDAVHALGREPLHLILNGVRGTTRISATSLARMAEQAAATVPGIRLVLARGSDAHITTDPTRTDPTRTDPTRTDPTPTGTSPHAVGVAGQHTVIQLAVVATYGQSLPDVAAEVRTTVAHHLRALASAEGIAVDIYIHDVLPSAS